MAVYWTPPDSVSLKTSLLLTMLPKVSNAVIVMVSTAPAVAFRRAIPPTVHFSSLVTLALTVKENGLFKIPVLPIETFKVY